MRERIDSFQGEFAFLSNFYPLAVPVVDQFRLTYGTVENAYQAVKSMAMQDRREIQKLSPGKAKIAGSGLPLRSDWETIKRAVMAELLLQKFLLNVDLRVRLIFTHNAELIEGNHHMDVYWGVCNGKGENHLGRLLMAVRGLLQ